MISIIVSSYRNEYFEQLAHNIRSTIGVEYEIIRIENNNEFSIGTAYNKGANLAKYENLIFCHEDLLFCTLDWGKIIMPYFNLPNLGAWGIAGSDYIPYAPSGWYISDDSSYINILQHNKSGEVKDINNFNNDYIKAKLIDGVLIGTTKTIFSNHNFPEFVKGYHGYDTAFSLHLSEKYQNYVVGSIKIEHFSLGNPDKTWFENNIQIRDQFIHQSENQNVNDQLELKAYRKFIVDSFRFLSITDAVANSYKYLSLKKIGWRNLMKIVPFYFKNLIKSIYSNG